MDQRYRDVEAPEKRRHTKRKSTGGRVNRQAAEDHRAVDALAVPPVMIAMSLPRM